MNKAFSHYEWKNGAIGALSPEFPAVLSSWEKYLFLHDNQAIGKTDTHYIYVHEGDAVLFYGKNFYPMPMGTYACVPGNAYIASGRGIVITKQDYKGMFSIGGPAEHEGRLKYIDGCTDSLLIPPVMLGDPCLNLLYFPPNIDQTMHTHPSDRIGIIMSGKGKCVAINDDGEESIDLVRGMLFCIHANGKHKFQTPYGEHLRVLAFHPDSDYGPTHQFHPMLNRTMVEGVSASLLPEIQTK
jgi:mannose-6-phosphate isomerase-like protein (cupin superfamily)